MTKKYKSEVMASIHEMIEGVYSTDNIDKKTMREFDYICLTPIRPFTPEKIRALRRRERVSQTVFALYLNVSKSVVSQWERGEKRPAGASLKLLSLIDKKGLAIIA